MRFPQDSLYCSMNIPFLAILVVSGYPNSNGNGSVQALDQDGNYWCDLPELPSPYKRFGGTMEGNILCGGYSLESIDVSRNCIYYKLGSWINPMDILNEARLHSSSWGRPHPNYNVGESHIYGGTLSPNTSEIANEVNSYPSYNYTDG